jgi:hypothetical protein
MTSNHKAGAMFERARRNMRARWARAGVHARQVDRDASGLEMAFGATHIVLRTSRRVEVGRFRILPTGRMLWVRPVAKHGTAKSCRRVAYHEAGHVIAALRWIEPLDLMKATIKATPGRRSAGHVLRRVRYLPEEMRERLERCANAAERALVQFDALTEIRYSLAGYAANSIHTGNLQNHPVNVDDGPNGDTTTARAYAHAICPSDADVERVLMHEYLRVRRLLRNEWDGRVRIFADALVRHVTLRGRRLRALLERLRWPQSCGQRRSGGRLA